jgi:hypothetical protein
MEDPSFEVEPLCLFSESAVWQLNHDYYQKEGIRAWQTDKVPHHMTSNSFVGKTYAEVILGMLRDLSFKGKTEETLYIMELGAGHGRLAFHILQHLERLTANLNITLPPYCYVISDIAEVSLSFFLEHPQLKSFFEQGKLDVCFFDSNVSDQLELRYSKRTVKTQDLEQPLVLVANYFFDSIPTDLFHVKNKKLSSCLAALHSDVDPSVLVDADLIGHMNIKFFKEKVEGKFYEDQIFNEILENYRTQISDSFIFFPVIGFQCLRRLEVLSKEGIMLLSMDKGFHGLASIDNKPPPELILHGSFSIWVNYHAFDQYCQKRNGKSLLPSLESFYSPVVCLLMMRDADDYKETAASYENFVTRFGPDDFNGIKRHTYEHGATLNLKEILALIHLSCYDSTYTIRFLPQIEEMAKHISMVERAKLMETIGRVWQMYFSINESYDLAYEFGGLLYELGFYTDALGYYAHSNQAFGITADVLYNQALCHYQLKEDAKFIKVKEAGKFQFPENLRFAELDALDMT